MPLHDERLISLGEAAGYYSARTGLQRPSPSTLFRHARKGLKIPGANGRVKLEHVRIGGRLFTTEEAIERFWQRVAHADAGHFDAA